MENLPYYIGICFILTTLVTVGLFYKAARQHPNLTMIVLLTWIAIQAFIAITGFYTQTTGTPPRFMLLVLPPLICIICLFLTAKGKEYLDGLEGKTLTLLHTVRIPVELVLFWLYTHHWVPQLMTFEGRNFDILSGLTAPVVFYFGFIRKTLPKTILLIWNFICLGLLLNIVINAVLSAPFPFQQFAFDQPNMAVLYFPFVWLPGCIVPLVLLAHLATIRQLMRKTTVQ
jgi:hypothetical protein